MPEPTPGLAACRDLYVLEVAPVLADDFPGLAHSAAVMAAASEVLGFDDVMSTDHDWRAACLGLPCC